MRRFPSESRTTYMCKPQQEGRGLPNEVLEGTAALDTFLEGFEVVKNSFQPRVAVS